MRVIKIHHPYSKEQIPSENIVMVLGFFDGVHLGHQKVIQEGKRQAKAKGLKLAVMTFNQHPSIVFQKIQAETMKYLTSTKQKEQKMASLGVDYLYEISFTSAFARLTPQEFVLQYLVQLHAEVVVAGFDYTYGPRDVATMDNLPLYAQGRFDIVCVGKQEWQDEKISSTRIRALLDTGNLNEANRLLGYTYTIDGTVVHGDARGRTLGFPTANIQVARHVRLPKVGVYAVKIRVGDTWYEGMASIGYNVTFGIGRAMTVEVYILNFYQDIYGESVEVAWYQYLREEIKFDGVESLIAQLKKDETDTRRYFLNESSERV